MEEIFIIILWCCCVSYKDYEKMKTKIQKTPYIHQLSIMGEYKNGRIRS
ncbi:hypothetical protein [Blattabacterium cuenoti]